MGDDLFGLGILAALDGAGDAAVAGADGDVERVVAQRQAGGAGRVVVGEGQPRGQALDEREAVAVGVEGGDPAVVDAGSALGHEDRAGLERQHLSRGLEPADHDFQGGWASTVDDPRVNVHPSTSHAQAFRIGPPEVLAASGRAVYFEVQAIPWTRPPRRPS